MEVHVAMTPFFPAMEPGITQFCNTVAEYSLIRSDNAGFQCGDGNDHLEG